MRVTSQSAFLALLPALVHAVSLSDMTPRAQNLPDKCNQIYESQISGCGVSDFTTQSCTDTCAKALQALVGPIKSACGGQGVTGQNLVVAYLAGVGPEQICPNAASSGGGESSAASEQTSTPRPTPTPSPTPSPTSTTSTSSREMETSETLQSTSLLVDTSSAAPSPTRTRTPAFSGTTRATSLTHQQSSTSTAGADESSRTATANEAKSTDLSESAQQAAAEDQSGGGSPFDEEGNMYSGADSLSSTSVLVSLGIAVLVVAFLFR